MPKKTRFLAVVLAALVSVLVGSRTGVQAQVSPPVICAPTNQPTTSGYVLTALGSGQQCQWEELGVGGVSITATSGLTASPSTITGTGSIGLSSVSNNTALCNNSGSSAAPTTGNCTISGTGNLVAATNPTITGPLVGGSLPSTTSGDLALGGSATLGGLISGKGSSNDLTFENTGGSTICVVATGTTTLGCVQFSATSSGSNTAPAFQGGTETGFYFNSDTDIIATIDGTAIMDIGGNLKLKSTTGLFWATGAPTGSTDTSMARSAAGLVEVGTSSIGSGGSLIATAYESGGTKFTASGCTNSTTVGGATAGSLALGANAPCTLVITMNGATGITAPNGWACAASDETAGLVVPQSAYSQTTASLAVPTGGLSGDTVVFHCIGF